MTEQKANYSIATNRDAHTRIDIIEARMGWPSTRNVELPMSVVAALDAAVASLPAELILYKPGLRQTILAVIQTTIREMK